MELGFAHRQSDYKVFAFSTLSYSVSEFCNTELRIATGFEVCDDLELEYNKPVGNALVTAWPLCSVEGDQCACVLLKNI